jgi:hypothetical protein
VATTETMFAWRSGLRMKGPCSKTVSPPLGTLRSDGDRALLVHCNANRVMEKVVTPGERLIIVDSNAHAGLDNALRDLRRWHTPRLVHHLNPLFATSPQTVARLP